MILTGRGWLAEQRSSSPPSACADPPSPTMATDCNGLDRQLAHNGEWRPGAAMGSIMPSVGPVLWPRRILIRLRAARCCVRAAVDERITACRLRSPIAPRSFDHHLGVGECARDVVLSTSASRRRFPVRHAGTHISKEAPVRLPLKQRDQRSERRLPRRQLKPISAGWHQPILSDFMSICAARLAGETSGNIRNHRHGQANDEYGSRNFSSPKTRARFRDGRCRQLSRASRRPGCALPARCFGHGSAE